MSDEPGVPKTKMDVVVDVRRFQILAAEEEAPRLNDAVSYVRPGIRALHGYSPGEQQPGFTKLNTNARAIAPSPRVRQVLGAIADESQRLSPAPVSLRLRAVASERFALRPT